VLVLQKGIEDLRDRRTRKASTKHEAAKLLQLLEGLPPSRK